MVWPKVIPYDRRLLVPLNSCGYFLNGSCKKMVFSQFCLSTHHSLGNDTQTAEVRVQVRKCTVWVWNRSWAAGWLKVKLLRTTGSLSLGIWFGIGDPVLCKNASLLSLQIYQWESGGTHVWQRELWFLTVYTLKLLLVSPFIVLHKTPKEGNERDSCSTFVYLGKLVLRHIDEVIPLWTYEWLTVKYYAESIQF